jgi:putative acyl-CoA dehydrogenase
MPFRTHEVTNQPPELTGHDTFGSNLALREALEREGAEWAAAELHAVGDAAGSAEAAEWGRQANDHPPVLRTHDRFGRRTDVVDYHPSYHRLMETAVAFGMAAAPWGDEREGAHVARAAKLIAWSPVEYGHTCPISMTYSVVATRSSPRSGTPRTWPPAGSPACGRSSTTRARSGPTPRRA